LKIGLKIIQIRVGSFEVKLTDFPDTQFSLTIQSPVFAFIIPDQPLIDFCFAYIQEL